MRDYDDICAELEYLADLTCLARIAVTEASPTPHVVANSLAGIEEYTRRIADDLSQILANQTPAT